jgi:hypothetical protein
MGISLTGLTPATTYDALIKVGDNGPITSALKVLSDGLGTNLPMEASTTGVNFTGTAQVGGVGIANTTQVAAKQDTLVSGTNIKTINGASVLGSGNIVTPNVSGVSGAIQFSDGSAFASDAANFFWDDTNNRLGVGTNTPTTALHIVKTGTGATIRLSNIGSSGSDIIGGNNFRIVNTTSGAALSTDGFWQSINNQIGINTNAQAATLHIKGSGSTSATTSLLVQNISAIELLRVRDDGRVYIGTTGYFLPDSQSTSMYNFYNKAVLTSTENSNIVKVLLAQNTHSFCGAFGGVNGQVGVNTNTPNASAALDIVSTTSGVLFPRMTTTQKNAITAVAGLVLYDSTTNKLCCYNGSTWNDLF